ncbi:protein hupE [Roseibium polysiphoniae]|uniref:Protein hupE n=1 Tax=Roseibium polysiphoniae TaxID=2571221 RepID=A0A944GSX6_9HYPH|nr:HupE/UreJ family protein [Roseibium polysiphoniae]MBS8261278.1 protein hupE [Roseibium polysiphoniae]
MTFQRFAAAAAFLLLSSPAHAHLDPATHGSFAAGFTHPVFGLDHVLAMIAVGLWAALIGGKAIWALPSAFVGLMIAGFGLSLLGVHVPMVEPVILASVVALGALVALAARFALLPSALLVGVFGFFHGHAHGGEIGGAGELGYAAGFVAATALLHAAGVLIGYGAKVGLGPETRRGELATRFLGGVTALCGLALMAA